MPLEVKVFYLFYLLSKSYYLEVSLKSQLLQSLKSMCKKRCPVVGVNVSSLTLATFSAERIRFSMSLLTRNKSNTEAQI